MRLKRIFADIWDALKNPYSPFYPAPEVREKLESEGWKFEHYCTPTPYAVAMCYLIRTPEGRLVDGVTGHRDDFTRYEIAYDRAVKECEAQKNRPQTPQP